MTGIEALQQSGLLSSLDVHFARFLGRLGEGRPECLLAAALASRAAGRGHTCLPLAWAAADLGGAAPCLGPRAWGDALRRSPVVGAPDPGGASPLVLAGPPEAPRLYLRRHFEDEHRVAAWVAGRAAETLALADPERAREALALLFPGGAAGGEPDRQRVAAAAALLKSLLIVSGGPGTGKTTAVARLLALLGATAGRRLRVALAAPTGKAAARLQESLRALAPTLPAGLRAGLPDRASTLHRLLGASPGAGGREARPLACDVLVVDEVSMVDLGLMARLTAALPARARVILLGDRDQLASVEAGAVLGDLCAGGAGGFSAAFAAAVAALTGDGPERLAGVSSERPAGAYGPGGLGDCLVLLTKSRRFGEGSGIGAVAAAVNRGDPAAALEVLASPDFPDARRRPAPQVLARELGPALREGFGPYLRAGGPEEAFDAFGRFRLLCAHRDGPCGVVEANAAAERVLAAAGLLQPGFGEWYAGRPVVVTQNDYGVKLMNGDVGLALPDPQEGGALRVFFPQAGGGLRRLSPLRVPPCDTVFAMTVHKSQGSEFDRVLLLLGDRPTRALTRELVYTGLTRARREVEVWSSEEAFREAVAHRTERASGLGEALWG